MSNNLELYQFPAKSSGYQPVHLSGQGRKRPAVTKRKGRNPIAKHLKFNRLKVFRDRSKYDRKRVH